MTLGYGGVLGGAVAYIYIFLLYTHGRQYVYPNMYPGGDRRVWWRIKVQCQANASAHVSASGSESGRSESESEIESES